MADRKIIDDQALDGLAVAPDAAQGDSDDHPYPRPAHDAHDDPKLSRNPGDEDAKLDVALDETFPTSDPPASTQPGKGSDPAPSSGFDPDAEPR